MITLVLLLSERNFDRKNWVYDRNSTVCPSLPVYTTRYRCDRRLPPSQSRIMVYLYIILPNPSESYAT